MAECKSSDWDERLLRKYFFPTSHIERLSCMDPRADDLINRGLPVVLTDLHIAEPAVSKWSLQYLSDHISDGDYTVFHSPSHVFKYHDEQKSKDPRINFIPPTRRVMMKFQEFKQCLNSWSPGQEHLYLQQALNNTVGEQIVVDFLEFDWKWIKEKVARHKWGALTSNLLLVSQPGNVTPCHYDEQQNLFVQLRGYKRCILFPPEMFESLYPHPVYHPHDRQSMVDFEAPDFQKFPKLSKLSGLEAIVGPGDVLYLPIYWWHHIESLRDSDVTISLNFWFKSGPVSMDKVEYPLKAHQKIAIMRNVEKMILEVMKDPREVDTLLNTLVAQRFADLSQVEDSQERS